VFFALPSAIPFPFSLSLQKASEIKEKGNTAFKEGRWDDALALFTAAIELDPTNHVFFANRSAASLNLKQFTRALNDASTFDSLRVL